MKLYLWRGSGENFGLITLGNSLHVWKSFQHFSFAFFLFLLFSERSHMLIQMKNVHDCTTWLLKYHSLSKITMHAIILTGATKCARKGKILRPIYTCDFWCDFWCDFAYKTRLTLPCTNVFFAKHRVDWKERNDILFADILLSNFC